LNGLRQFGAPHFWHKLLILLFMLKVVAEVR